MLSERISRIEVSSTMEVARRCTELKSKGIDIIDLCVGEPDFPTPQNIIAAAKQAMEKGLTGYTINQGIPELRQEIAKKYESETGSNFSLQEIIVSTGAKQAIYNVLQSIITTGEEVLIPSPYYVSYTHMVKLAGGIPVIIETDEHNNFKIKISELEKKITAKTKALIFCNPSNPTGTVYLKDEINKIVEFAVDRDLIIIADEVYEKFIYDNLKFTSLANFKNKLGIKCIITNAVSKTYAMTGWRIGYAIADANIISAANKIQSHSTSSPNSIAQYAAVEALSGNQDSVNIMRNEFEKRRNYLYNELNSIEGISCRKSNGAFYLFPNVKKLFGKKFNGFEINNSTDLCMYLLTESKVALVPGEGFGAPDNIRIAYTNSMEKLIEAIKRIKTGLK